MKLFVIHTGYLNSRFYLKVYRLPSKELR
jgi:hypothetical protein